MKNIKITGTAILLASTLAFTGCPKNEEQNISKNSIETNTTISKYTSINVSDLKKVYICKIDNEYKLVVIYKISNNFFRINNFYYFMNYKDTNGIALQSDVDYEVFNFEKDPLETLDKENIDYFPILPELEKSYGKKDNYSEEEIKFISDDMIKKVSKPIYTNLRKTRYPNLVNTYTK